MSLQKKCNSLKKLNVLVIEESTLDAEEYRCLILRIVSIPCDIYLFRKFQFHEHLKPTSYHLALISGGASCLSTLEYLKKVYPQICVIVVSQQATIEEAVAVIRMGAEDYLSKPLSQAAFERTIKRCIEQLQIQAGFEDCNARVKESSQFLQMAYLDDATGLYNARYFNTALDLQIAQSRESLKSFALLFIDIDKFKTINATYGHLVGTRVLNELGFCLKQLVRANDIIFRYGGDEFVIILSPSDFASANRAAREIYQQVAKKYFLMREGLSIQFTVSIGVALFPDHAKTKKEIINMADNAMYCAKRKYSLQTKQKLPWLSEVSSS